MVDSTFLGRGRHPNQAVELIVKMVNETQAGMLTLKQIRNLLYPQVDPEGKVKLAELLTVVQTNSKNFIINPDTDSEAATGDETVWVRTQLGLCKMHCRRGAKGTNGKCSGNCGALHLCRTFLLKGEACPFNTKKKRCMFGHKFDTEHNMMLLYEHNLNILNEMELRKLFRRRPSRTEMTLQQVCIYYNGVGGKQCANGKCTSLHICSNFVQKNCLGDCRLNHKLSSEQVEHVLGLFAVDNAWPDEAVLEDIRHFMTPRHRGDRKSCSSDDDDSISVMSTEDSFEHEERGAIASEFYDASKDHGESDSGRVSDVGQTCCKCDELKKEINRMQLNISWLTSQVQDLRKITEEVKLRLLLCQSENERKQHNK